MLKYQLRNSQATTKCDAERNW